MSEKFGKCTACLGAGFFISRDADGIHNKRQCLRCSGQGYRDSGLDFLENQRKSDDILEEIQRRDDER